MNFQSPRVWVVFFSISGVLYLGLSQAGNNSPGDLAAVHDRDSELSSRQGCVICHGSGEVSLAFACLECHEVIQEHVDGEIGLHGGLGEDAAMKCATCHSDHHGTRFQLINQRSFALAGVLDAAAFPHDLVGWDMHGKHLELDCTECHEHADVEVLPEGELRYLGLTKDCTSCHEDPHEGTMDRACADCHGQNTFEDFAPFEHDAVFPLVGSHARATCVDCHSVEDVRHSVGALDSGTSRPPVRECIDCHESPHANPFLRNVARTIEMTEGQSCETCHVVEHEAFRDVGLEISDELHACSGFPLTSPHEDVSCADCHGLPEGVAVSPEVDFVARYPGRRPEQCGACHEDPHDGQFVEGQFSLGCIACHDSEAFEPHGFTLAKHARTGLALDGAHAELECSACHADPEPGHARLFQGTPENCDECHEDAHRGYFEVHTAGLPEHANGDCARCHRAGSFSHVEDRDFDHGFWTGFPIRGAHAQEACESCHPRTVSPDANGRTFGRASEHFGRIEGCESCHVDPHEGQFEGARYPTEVNGEQGCARCHVETSFRTFPDGFDHGRWTGFVLDGAHGRVACSECHPPVLGAAQGERTFERAAGQHCADCHGYPHAGQFMVDGKTDCVRCHSASALAFGDLLFDHDRDSRFPLDEGHAALACAECHRPWTLANQGEVVRYRPLGMECVDCHGRTEGERKKKAKAEREKDKEQEGDGQ